MRSDWPLVLGGLFGAILLAPLFVYARLVLTPTVLSGISIRLVGLFALVPGFLMGGIGLWMAARG